MRDELGIVRGGRWLLWAPHGKLKGLPTSWRKAIVAVWNNVSCSLFGHYLPLFQEEQGELPECVQCCRGVVYFKARTVVRLWEIAD